jgi:hypothetical protein
MSKIGLNKFLKKFPDNATSWRYATDEVRDIARTAKEYYNELEYKNLKACNFRSFTKPSEWNTKGKKYINMVYNKMNAKTKKEFNLYLKKHWNIN